MKTFVRTVLIGALITWSSVAQADWSANLGFASEYYYRGIFQESTSANGGLDFESGGFYAGTWAADVGDGLEVDGYFGYGFDVGDVNLSVGYTGYFYTGDFDDTYQEINLGAGLGLLTLDGVKVKSGVSEVSSSGNLVDLRLFDSIFKFDSGHQFGQVIETA